MGTIRQDFFPGAPNKKNIHKGRRLFCEVKKNSIAPGVPKKDEYRLYFKKTKLKTYKPQQTIIRIYNPFYLKL